MDKSNENCDRCGTNLLFQFAKGATVILPQASKLYSCPVCETWSEFATEEKLSEEES